MAQSCGGDAVSMQGAVVKALVRLVMEQPVVLFASKNGTASNHINKQSREAWGGSTSSRVVNSPMDAVLVYVGPCPEPP